MKKAKMQPVNIKKWAVVWPNGTINLCDGEQVARVCADLYMHHSARVAYLRITEVPRRRK